MFLADKASDDGSGIWCSKGTIHRHTELGESTVKRAVNELVQEGILIETGQHRRCKHGYTVVYHMNLAIVQTLELISEPYDKVGYPTGSRVDGGHTERGTGSVPDGAPGPERTPNNPKTILKPPTRARMPEGMGKNFEAAWNAYPADRRATLSHSARRTSRQPLVQPRATGIGGLFQRLPRLLEFPRGLGQPGRTCPQAHGEAGIRFRRPEADQGNNPDADHTGGRSR